MAEKKRIDPESEAAMEVVEMGQRREKIVDLDGKSREKLIAKIHEDIGRIQGAKLVSQFADVASLIWLKQVKENKLYRDLPGFRSWESFCNYINISRSKADEDLKNLEILGENFLTTVGTFKMGYRELRKLRYAARQGDVIIEADAITIGEDKIPLAPDHAEDLEAAIEALLEDKNKKLEEAESIIKGKERVIAGHIKTIGDQEKLIAKHERKLKEKGLLPGEEQFYEQLSDIKGLFDLWEGKLDPVDIDLKDSSPRMKATYIETLGYMARIADELHQKAVDMYGNPTIDADGYIFPANRKAADGQ